MTFIRKQIVKEDTTPEEVVDAGINAIANQDANPTDTPSEVPTTESNEVITEELTYNWLDVIDILKDYLDPNYHTSMYNLFSQEYADKSMTEADLIEIFSDLSEMGVDSATLQEIEDRLEQVTNASVDKKTDLGVIEDAIDKIQDLSIKEKLVQLLDSLKQ